MANWTAHGFVGKMITGHGQMVPPPPGIFRPLWGDESTVRQRLGAVLGADLHARSAVGVSVSAEGNGRVLPPHFGPTNIAFSRLDAAGQAELAAQLESLWIEHNTATDGTTAVEDEYLEVRAIRA